MWFGRDQFTIETCTCFQENPKESRCLGVFGLSLYTQERELREIFGKYGPVEEVQVVYDHQTGRSRGFAFIYMRNVEDAIDVSSSSLSDRSRFDERGIVR